MDLMISQGETKQKRPGLSESKASFKGAAERALEISHIHAHAGSNTGDVYKKLQRLVNERVVESRGRHGWKYRISRIDRRRLRCN